MSGSENHEREQFIVHDGEDHIAPFDASDLQWGDIEAIEQRLNRIQNGELATGPYPARRIFCIFCGDMGITSSFTKGNESWPNGGPTVCADCENAMAYRWFYETIDLKSRYRDTEDRS